MNPRELHCTIDTARDRIVLTGPLAGESYSPEAMANIETRLRALMEKDVALLAVGSDRADRVWLSDVAAKLVQLDRSADALTATVELLKTPNGLGLAGLLKTRALATPPMRSGLAFSVNGYGVIKDGVVQGDFTLSSVHIIQI